MSFSIAQLRAMSDAELIATHDALARNTSVGINYYLDEIERRERERAAKESQKLARAAFVVSIVGTILSVIATVAAVVALFIAGG
jgi:CHASE3 domain sensor protein